MPNYTIHGTTQFSAQNLEFGITAASHTNASNQKFAPQQSAVDLRKLHSDIDDLTTDAKIECATHPMDAGAQKKLQTLQTLKEILDSGSASEQDLVDIRDSIMQQMAKRLAEKHQQSPQALSPPVQYPPFGQQVPQYPVSDQTSASTHHQQANTPTVLPFLSSANLADLLRATANGTPSQGSQQIQPQIIATPPTANATPAPVANELPLLAQLRASGLLSSTSTPPQGATTPTRLSTLLSQVSASGDVPFTSASIKITRPQLLLNFLGEKPNQCTTCGRRFTLDEAGKVKKDRHLDWHFKTKARLLEAEQRGQNRSWYVDEREWIASREYEDGEGIDVESNPSQASNVVVNSKQQDFVRAPSDPALRNAMCPIDQEPFSHEWSPELQDFIWKDAVRVGDRYYHASCYQDLVKQKEGNTGRSTPLSSYHRRTATPDSVLGKRKAEDDDVTSASKLRVKLEI